MTTEAVKTLALHVAAMVASANEAKRRGEIEDFEIVVKSDGSYEVRTVRR